MRPNLHETGDFVIFTEEIVTGKLHFCTVFLKDVRINNTKRLIIGQLNINILRDKFEQSSAMISGNADIFMISETNLIETFPIAQVSLQGFSNPYRFDRNRSGGVIMFYIREDIPSRLIERKFLTNTEYFFGEINFIKKKWLLCCYCNLRRKNSILNA